MTDTDVRKKPRVPDFKSIEEEAAFWDSVDFDKEF